MPDISRNRHARRAAKTGGETAAAALSSDPSAPAKSAAPVTKSAPHVVPEMKPRGGYDFSSIFKRNNYDVTITGADQQTLRINVYAADIDEVRYRAEKVWDALNDDGSKQSSIAWMDIVQQADATD